MSVKPPYRSYIVKPHIGNEFVRCVKTFVSKVRPFVDYGQVGTSYRIDEMYMVILKQKNENSLEGTLKYYKLSDLSGAPVAGGEWVNVERFEQL